MLWLGAALPAVLLAGVWRAARRRPHLIGSLDSPALALAASQDGSSVAALTQSGAVRVWSNQHRVFRALPFDGSNTFRNWNPPSADDPAQLQFSPDGRSVFASTYFLLTSGGEMARCWSATSRKALWSAFPNGTEDLGRFWMSSDGTRLIQRTWTWGKVFDLTSPCTPQPSKWSRTACSFAPVQKFDFHATKTIIPQELALTHDDSTLIVLENGGSLAFWDVTKGNLLKQGKFLWRTPAPSPKMQIVGTAVIAPSPNDHFVAVCNGATLWLWSNASHTWTRTITISRAQHNIAWAPDSRSFWISGDAVQELGAPDLRPLRTLPVSGPVALSGDGQTLVTRSVPKAGEGAGVWTWNVG